MRLIIIFLTLCALLIVGCTSNVNMESETCSVGVTCNVVKDSATNSVESSSKISVDKIEVYHFHGASQCFSCKTIKTFAEKTVNLYYTDLLESGKMEFRSINGDLPENREMVMKYGATGSSLWIGTYIDGEFHKEQNTNVWYKVNNEEDFLTYLKSVLDKRLVGDLS